MITFKPTVRYIRNDGYSAVKIRITFNRKIDYIDTNLVVNKKQIKGEEIIDYSIIAKASYIIETYFKKLNEVDIEGWSIEDIIKFLINDKKEISFTDFAYLFTDKIRNSGREKTSRKYINALNSVTKYMGKENINFSDLNSKVLNGWIESISDTKEAKSHYPMLLNAIFKAGLLEYNDYDMGVLRIKHHPFMKVSIPKKEVPEKRAIEKNDLIKIFKADLENVKRKTTAPLAKDIVQIVFCLAGINTVDLFNMDKSCFKNGKLCYSRTKTRGKRMDKAYIEIKIPERINLLIEKYKGKDRLFSFCEMYSTPDNFSKYINKGLKEITEDVLKIEKATVYTFRHSWATIARNECGASEEEVAFALNHSSAHKVTRGYIKIDYSPIDKLNESVLNYVFQ